MPLNWTSVLKLQTLNICSTSKLSVTEDLLWQCHNLFSDKWGMSQKGKRPLRNYHYEEQGELRTQENMKHYGAWVHVTQHVNSRSSFWGMPPKTQYDTVNSRKNKIAKIQERESSEECKWYHVALMPFTPGNLRLLCSVRQQAWGEKLNKFRIQVFWAPPMGRSLGQSGHRLQSSDKWASSGPAP